MLRIHFDCLYRRDIFHINQKKIFFWKDFLKLVVLLNTWIWKERGTILHNQNYSHYMYIVFFESWPYKLILQYIFPCAHIIIYRKIFQVHNNCEVFCGGNICSAPFINYCKILECKLFFLSCKSQLFDFHILCF